MLLFAPRVNHVDTLRVHVGVKSFHRQNFCQCFVHVHPCSWYPLVDPYWTSLGAAEPGSVKSNFLVRFMCSQVLEAVICCQVLV